MLSYGIQGAPIIGFSGLFSGLSRQRPRVRVLSLPPLFPQKTGCADIKLEKDDYRIIDTKSKTYTIGTDTFPLEGVRYSGVFKIFTVGTSGFLKMTEMDEPITQKKGGEFIGVRDMFLKSFISHGICKFQK